MTADEIRALEPSARRRLRGFADCFKRARVFDYFVKYSLGLLADFDRKSIEPIALWIGAAVRALQLFLSQFAWDHARIESRLLSNINKYHQKRNRASHESRQRRAKPQPLPGNA